MGIPAPPPDPPMPPGGPPDSNLAHKWQAIAAVTSAVVGILTFGIGFIGLPAAGVKSPLEVRETETVTATATVTSDETSSGPDSPTDVEAPKTQWSGSLLLESDFDLDSIPPVIGDWDLKISDFTAREAVLIYNDYALVPEGENPGFNECKLLQSTKSQSRIEIPEGRSVCLKTDEERIVLVVIDSLDFDTEAADISVTVWEKE